jgi:hypothetical protein
MKQSIYDRIPQIETCDLNDLIRFWTRLCNDRPRLPRHDYWGKCIIRAVHVLEERGALPHPKKPIRRLMRSIHA